MVGARYMLDGTDLEAIQLLAELRLFMQNVKVDEASDVPDRVGNGFEKWHFEGMIIAEDSATFGIRGNVQEMRRICKNSGDAISMKIVKILDLTCKGWETKCENAYLSEKNTGMQAEVVDLRAIRSVMCDHLEAAERQ